MTSGQLVFRIGDAFPADNPVAVFLVAMSTALNDLLLTNRQLLGGDDSEPGLYEVDPPEHLFLLRSSISQVWELRESLRHARKQDAVEKFLANLPQKSKQHLAAIEDPNRDDAPWIEEAIKHIRHQTNHYGGKWNWTDLEWAMDKIADGEGAIEMSSSKVAGMRLRFADEIAAQHLMRKFPEYAEGVSAEVDNEAIQARLRTLFTAIGEFTSAALAFICQAIEAYFEALPEGVIRAEPRFN